MTSQSPLSSHKSVLQPFEALCRGSVFESLADSQCAAQIKAFDPLPFALCDLKLYLDTHPCDLIIHALYRRLCMDAGLPISAPVYDNTYCPLRWTWIDGPWPWEAPSKEE